MKSLILICAASLMLIVNMSFAVPPGLQGKDLPAGLSNQNRTPHGWTEGEKRGWTKSHHYYHHHRHHYNSTHELNKVRRRSPMLR